MIDKIVAIYAITDDILKAIGHREDVRRQMTDAEILTTAFAAAMFFGANQSKACEFMYDTGLMPQMLDKSRFCRRLHAISGLMLDLFHQLGMALKQANESTEYLLDSFPVALCDNIRIRCCRLIHSEDYRGYIASKKRYFYGVRVHLLSTTTGIPVEFVCLPGAANDVRGLGALPLNLPLSSEVYGDSAYTDYDIEDTLKLTEDIGLKVIRKSNSKRQDPPWTHYYKQCTRHQIETVFSQITQRFPKSIHAVTFEGFLLKLSAFIFAFTLEQAFL